MMEIKPKQFEVNGTERPINLRRKTILDRYFILGSLIICNRTLNQEPITGRQSLQNTCCYWRLQNKKDRHFKNSETWTYSRGGSRIFLGGGALVACSTSTPINHIVFFFGRIPVVLENCRSSQGGECAHPLHPPPRSAPVQLHNLHNQEGRTIDFSWWVY